MYRTALLSCLLLTAAGPATVPTTSPADAVTLQAKLDAANARIATLEAEVADLRMRLGGATERAERSEAAAVAAAAQTASIKDNGSVRALKRIVNDHVRVGMSLADVTAILGTPKTSRREADGTVHVYQRADLGRQVHGTFTPGARYTYELAFDDTGKLTTISGVAK